MANIDESWFSHEKLHGQTWVVFPEQLHLQQLRMAVFMDRCSLHFFDIFAEYLGLINPPGTRLQRVLQDTFY